MAAPTFRVSILTPLKKIYESDAESLVAPASMGYAGILANHAPYMTTLTAGTVTIRDGAGKVTKFKTESGGFMEVLRNRATILVDSAEPRA